MTNKTEALQAAVCVHLAGLKPEFNAITIEQLLNHTSGLPGDYRNPARSKEDLSVDELFAMAAATRRWRHLCAAADLVRWTHALHTGRVLAPATYAAMTTPRGVAAESNYGLGQYVRPAPWGGKVITHGGQSLAGRTSELQRYVDGSIAYAMLYNSAPRTPGISDLIPRIVMGVPLPEKSK